MRILHAKLLVGLVREVNANAFQRSYLPLTIAEVCDHFIQRELHQENSWRSHSTKKTYRAYLNRWVIPNWGSMRLSEVRTTDVESWLRSLPVAKSSCAEIRGILSVLFNHPCRHELFDRNPIRLVRQGAKRRTTPNVFTPAEIKALMSGLGLRERTLVLLAASTGLRQSELFGLKWGDINFAQGTMNVTRSIVYGVVGPCKTESSQKPVPVDPTVLEALGTCREGSRFTKYDDWVFASRRHRGRKPIWGQAILRKYIRPVALRVGIQKRFGWHTFRQTYSTLLRSVGTEFKVMQELLRHSSLRSTLDVYTQAISPAKHAAQAAVLSLVFASRAELRCGGAKRTNCESGAYENDCNHRKGVQKGCKTAPFCTLLGFREIGTTLLE